jgi:hypothetical protein
MVYCTGTSYVPPPTSTGIAKAFGEENEIKCRRSLRKREHHHPSVGLRVQIGNAKTHFLFVAFAVHRVRTKQQTGGERRTQIWT